MHWRLEIKLSNFFNNSFLKKFKKALFMPKFQTFLQKNKNVK